LHEGSHRISKQSNDPHSRAIRDIKVRRRLPRFNNASPNMPSPGLNVEERALKPVISLKNVSIPIIRSHAPSEVPKTSHNHRSNQVFFAKVSALQ
jgi:hypothetical protein